MLPVDLTSVIQDPAVMSFVTGLLANASWDTVKGSFRTFGQVLHAETSVEHVFRELRAESRISRNCELVIVEAIRHLDEADRIKVALDADLMVGAVRDFLLGRAAQPSLVGELRACFGHEFVCSGTLGR